MTAQAAGALRRLVTREDGQGMAEYGLILLLVSIVSVVVLQLVGVDVLDFFTTAADAVDDAVS